jgi:FPC/CPF motif-containing protein YcgG
MTLPDAANPDAASSYALFDDGRLLMVADGSPAPALSDRVHAAFRALVLDPEFPCVGARSAMNQGSYRFAMYPELATSETTAVLARDLRSFVDDQPEIVGEFTTFIAVFDAPKVLTPEDFEALLWEQLRLLHDLDEMDWDPTVNRDVGSKDFSFSFHGRAYFIVGLAPSGSRWARTFSWPALAFNSHAQFEALRASGQFGRIQEVIRDRDEKLEGDINPNLTNFGEHTEAKQYSGREVAEAWRCPVRFDA